MHAETHSLTTFPPPHQRPLDCVLSDDKTVSGGESSRRKQLPHRVSDLPSFLRIPEDGTAIGNKHRIDRIQGTSLAPRCRAKEAYTPPHVA